MLLSVRNLYDFKIEATDGGIGEVDSFLFDDKTWTIRYLVVDTGTWLPGRKVLVTPSALGKPDSRLRVFPVKLTRDQIKKSPDIDTNKPVSRQQEIKLHEYYNWVPYWGGTLSMAVPPYAPATSDYENEPDRNYTKKKSNPHLRSTRKISGYKIHANDGQIGHIDDFIIHEEDWIIRYIVVDTRKWLAGGGKVIIPPDWIKHISWADSEVTVDVSMETVKESPEFDPSAPVNREYETRLYDYYGRPKYWQ